MGIEGIMSILISAQKDGIVTNISIGNALNNDVIGELEKLNKRDEIKDLEIVSTETEVLIRRLIVTEKGMKHFT